MHVDHNYHHSMETLNICNYDDNCQIVLNDVKLLELVQIYPFLYNPHIKPYRDPDYDEWAWNKIAVAFNKTYGYNRATKPFTVRQLRQRWEFLQPIVIGLSKVADTIPPEVEKHVREISVHLENQSPDVYGPEPLSKAQQIILDNIDMVENLPLHKRKQLEAEMMHLILKSELNDEFSTQVKEGKAILTDTYAIEVERECDEFFQKIGIDDLSLAKEIENSAKLPIQHQHTMSNETVASKNVSQLKSKNVKTQPRNASKNVLHIMSKYVKIQPKTDNQQKNTPSTTRRVLPNIELLKALNSPFYVNSGNGNDLTKAANPSSNQNDQVSNMSAAFKTPPPFKRIKHLDEQPSINNPKDSPSPTTNSMLTNYSLLERLDHPHWIEPDQVSFYIRKCRVRLKRFTPPEDNLPLAHIKRE